jgi:hypothetical protein
MVRECGPPRSVLHRGGVAKNIDCKCRLVSSGWPAFAGHDSVGKCSTDRHFDLSPPVPFPPGTRMPSSGSSSIGGCFRSRPSPRAMARSATRSATATTSRSPRRPTPNGVRFTAKPGALYAHVLGTPQRRTVLLKGADLAVLPLSRATLLPATEIAIETRADGLLLTLPEPLSQDPAHRVKLELEPQGAPFDELTVSWPATAGHPGEPLRNSVQTRAGWPAFAGHDSSYLTCSVLSS